MGNDQILIDLSLAHKEALERNEKLKSRLVEADEIIILAPNN